MEWNDRFKIANRKGRELQASQPRAVSARYDRRIGRVVITLNTNLDGAFSPRDGEGLEEASFAQLEAIEISPSRLGIAGIANQLLGVLLPAWGMNEAAGFGQLIIWRG